MIKLKRSPQKGGTNPPPLKQQLRKLSLTQYKLTIKDRKIKQLKMENELLRDFLSHTEVKWGKCKISQQYSDIATST